MDINHVLSAVNYYHHNAPTVGLYRDYFNGNHRYNFASPRFRQKFGWVLRSAKENLCPAVVYAHVDRLSIESFGANLDEAQQQGLTRLANLVHTEAFVSGQGAAITWYRPGTKDRVAVFHRADQIIPFIDSEQPDRLTHIGKVWLTPDGYGRINLYDAERLTRLVTTAKITHITTPDRTSALSLPDTAASWMPYNTDDAPSTEAHDFGTVPGVLWKRNAPSQFEDGISVLRDIISPQDRLNKVNADSVVAAERIALPLRYVMDVNPEQLQPRLNPATGLVEPPRLPFDPDIDSILAMSAKGPAGQFEGPNAAHISTGKQDLEGEIARISGIPAYYLQQTSGDVPSGESLRVTTSRLTSAVSTFQQDATPAWKGQLELLGFQNPVVEWADPSPMDTAEKIEVAVVKYRDLGYSLADAIVDLHEPDADKIVVNAAARTAADTDRVAGGLATGNFLS